MPSIRAMVSQQLFEDIGLEERKRRGENWRTATQRVLDPSDSGNVPIEDIEVMWFAYLDSINVTPLNIDVLFTIGSIGAKSVTQGQVDQLSDEFGKIHGETFLPGVENIAATWILAFGRSGTISRFSASPTRLTPRN